MAGADLLGADLKGADMRGANMYKTTLAHNNGERTVLNAELATWDMLPEIGVHAEIYSPLQEDVEGKVDSRGLVRRPTFWYTQDYSFRIVPAAGPTACRAPGEN